MTKNQGFRFFDSHLPCSTIITLPGKMPDIFWIAKWGFGEGPALQNSKESTSDDIKL